MSKLLCAALLLFAACKEKAADPPKPVEAAKPAPDPSPAARKADLETAAPKPTPDPNAGSGSGDGSAKPEPQTVDTSIKRNPDKPGGDRQPAGALVDRIKKKMDAKKDAADDKKKTP